MRKRTIALLAAGGFVLLAGAAMAAQSAVVNSTVHSPAGDTELVNVQPELPDGSAAAAPSPGDAVDQVNQQLDANGVPFQAHVGDNHVQTSLRCGAVPAPDPSLQPVVDQTCISSPGVDVPSNDYVRVDRDGAHLSQLVRVDTHDMVIQFVPDAVPADQRAQLMDLNDQVNGAVTAAVVDDASNGDCTICFRVPGGSGGVTVHPGKGLANAVASKLPLGNGQEAKWDPRGADEPFFGSGLSVPSQQGGSLDLGAQGGNAGSHGPDVGAMAVAAALVGAPLAGLALYHRIRRDHTLNNKTRQAVYDAVVRTPGIGVNEVAKASGCSYSTAAYHLERLVQERLLVCGEDGRRARYFKNGGAFSTQEREFVPILQSKECMDVLQVIVENPWCYRAEVAQRLGVSGPTVNWHLKKLMAAGVVKEMREGRVSYLYADKKLLTQIGANLVGKMPDDLVARMRFEARPAPEVVEPALRLPETTVPEVGIGEELELSPLPEAQA